MFELLRVLVLLWAGIGLGLAIWFLGPGWRRQASGGREASLGFRLLILPSAVLLWPLLLPRTRKPEAGP
ncbi:MAG: hypothetical protein H6807_00035 [Planctomycetes bacterium]|nr:hypothetical protein [Planctomycetota bacterium]